MYYWWLLEIFCMCKRIIHGLFQECKNGINIPLILYVTNVTN